ncbi:MAG: class I adenylate-forming enzyme family protein [Pikeienuella sp.]
MTVGNLLEKSIDGREKEVFFTSDESLDHYGVDSAGLTGAGLRDLINRLSNIVHHSGVQRFDRVAIWKANSLDYFLWSLAIMRRGAISTPVNGGMPAENMLRFIHHCGVRTLVTDKAGLDRLAASGAPLDALKQIFVTDGDGARSDTRVEPLAKWLGAAGIDYTPPYMSFDQHVIICHTSGTTGLPKGVLHGSDGFIAAAKGQMKIQFITRRNAILCPLWMNHHLSHAACLTSLAAGVRCHVITNHDAAHVLENIQRRKPRLLLSFPDVYQRMCAAGLENYDLSSVRMWMTTGDAMHEYFIRQLTAQGAFLRVFGTPVIGSLFMEFFGTSEIGSAALVKISERRTRQYGRMIGRPTPVGPAIRIGDAEGRPLPANTIGRIMVRGATLFKGYWNNHDRGHDVIREDWWWSGDVGYRDQFGRFYQIDRDVDTVDTALGPVYGLPIEEEALKLPGVDEAVLLARPGETGNEAVMMLQMAPDVRADPAALLEQLKASCLWAKNVSEILIATPADIPRGLTGKVLKRALRDSLRAAPEQQAAARTA